MLNSFIKKIINLLNRNLLTPNKKNLILYNKVIRMFWMFRRCCNKSYCNDFYRRCCCRKCCNRDYYDRPMDKFDVTMEQLKQMQLQGAIVCDIRSPQEYNEGHLSGAVLLPQYDIYRKCRSLFPNKNQVIILYCGTGERSYESLKRMQRLGYTNVYNLYKGTENY